jgi:hypothetical protein
VQSRASVWRKMNLIPGPFNLPSSHRLIRRMGDHRCSRYSLGAQPTNFLKSLLKCDWSK